MSYLLVSSVQQYTIDRLRVSFSNEYSVDILKNLSFSIIDSEKNDITDKFLSIKDSNDWSYTTSSNTLDIVLSKNMCLPEGNYTFKLLENENIKYESDVKLNYMEDIRTKFLSVNLESLDTLVIKFASLYEDDIYQSRQMLSLMNFSCIDESGVSYSDVFESFSDIISRIPEENEPITEVKLSLIPGRVLPKGYYTVRLTSRYKSRTFSILEDGCQLNFMTTTPPNITTSNITKKSNGEYVLTVTFGNYMEKSMMESSTRLILRSDGKNVSSYFDADRVSSTIISTAGVSYIVRYEIPLISEFYVLQKGKYTISYVFKEDYIDDVSSEINTDWCLKQIQNINLYNLDFITLRLPETVFYEEAVKLKYQIELDGNEVTEPEILDAFSDILFDNPLEVKPVDDEYDRSIFNIYIVIKNKKHLKPGTYSFIFYYEENEKNYKYIGYFNFKCVLTPKVINIYQSDIDRLTVELEKPLPIEVIEYCKMLLLDEYGNIDFSSRLESIHDSNIWEPGQVTVDRFYVMISNGVYLSSGKYISSLLFGDVHSSKFSVILSYMETRKGIIHDIIQKDLSNIEINFSEDQTRRFLLTTKFLVERESDGADFTDKFELLENVIKNDQYVISSLTIPMNHDESLPAGRYNISFIWKTSDKDYVTVYSLNVDLGYMTSSPPEISTTSTFIDSDGLLNLRIQFSNYLELDLFKQSIVSLVGSDDVDIISKMQPKNEWKLVTTSKKNITTIKNITMKALDTSLKFEKDSYNVIFSWEDVIQYLDDIETTVDIDYILPLTSVSEVTSIDTEKGIGRIYFEFNEVLQYAFFENLKVKVFNENNQDQTDIFGTIQNSNGIGPDTPDSKKVPTNNINLNILNINEITFGTYTFIFYHEKNGVKTSEYKSMLDIMAAISPSIKNMEQVGIDTILVNLKAAVPRMILETDSFRFVSFKNFDYTTYFKSIDESNNWDESVREVSSFYIKLKNGYKLNHGSYSFTMYAGNLRLDQCDISIEYMEGANISIEEVKNINLSTIEITFSEEQSTSLFKTLELQVFDSNGTDISYKFISLADAILNIKTDYFESLNLKILDGCAVPTGDYTFNIIKINKESEDTVIMSENVPLKYMSSEYPLLYEVTATKLYNGNDGILMTFIPALELDLFSNAGFVFNNISGMSVLDRFEPISEATLDTVEKDGITYINSATLEFDPEKTLNKDKYLIEFNWIGEYSYMRNLSCEVSLDYILFPVKSVELITSDTVEISFNKYLKNEYLKNTELVVTSIYQSSKDATVMTEVDFTDQFKLITETNDFDSLPDDINKIILRLKDGLTLPDATYRFIIAEKINQDDSTVLQYAYSGTLDVEILISKDILDSSASITQVSYDTLKIKFDKAQNTKFLNTCAISVVRTDTDQHFDFTSMFKSVKESNRYDVLDDQGNVIDYSYYIDEMGRDTVIDEIHYTVKEVNFIYLKLSDKSAIPSGTYSIYFTNGENKYFESSITTTFMTQEPPQISGIELVNEVLTVSFKPYAEAFTMYQSLFNIMTNRGIDSEGKIIGDDVTSYFNSILMSDITKIETSVGITYVPKISIPVSPDALLASGQYHITWKWGDNSFLPDSVFDGSFDVVAKGVKSALTYNFNTIKISLETEYEWKFIKGLDISVVNSNNKDCSDLFRTIEESNPETSDEVKVDSFFIMVEDGETVITDTYTFTLSYTTESVDGDEVSTSAFIFMMNIIYLADEFPSIEVVDNLSSINYTIQLLSNANISSFIGKYVQLLDDDNKELLTRLNSDEYIGNYVKVYEEASIDKLTIKFDNEVEPCLLNALDFTLIDEDGNDVSHYFNSIKSSNVFKSRKILNVIKITFRRNLLAEVINGYEINVYTADGINLTDKFISFWDANPSLSQNSITNNFILMVDDDELIESYNLDNLKILITDSDDVRITGFKHELYFRDTTTSNNMYMNLASNVTLAPGVYDLKFTYQNEPLLQDAVTINPFSYSGKLPFLSTSLGKIISVNDVDLSNIEVEFSEDLPNSIFADMTVHVYNEDMVDYGNLFDPLEKSNDFSVGANLSDLEKPRTIILHLSDDNILQSGMYTIEFDMKIRSNDVDEENEDDDTEPNTDMYKLWSYTTKLEYMSNEKPNSITDVTMEKIDTLKVNFENPIDLELLRNFNISLENNSNGYVYGSDNFVKLSESNDFGKYVLLTDNSYILTSDDGSSWSRFNTGKNLSFNDIYNDKENGIKVIACSGGKVVVFDTFSKSSFKEFQTPSKKNLTSISKIGKYYFVTGNDGIILRGEYLNNTFIWMTCNTGVTKTITKIANKSDTEMVAVGYNGTILYSEDAGLTWKPVRAAISSPTPNLTDIIYYDEYTTESGEIANPDNPGFYITGTNGTLLYSNNGYSMYTKIAISTSKSFYSISQHNGIIVLVGDSGTIFRSVDTETWRQIPVDASYSLKTIEWCDTKFIVCGSSGKWITSISGEYWNEWSSITLDTLKTAKFLDSQYDNNRKANYLYLKLNKNCSIGNIGLYTGTYIPDMTNNPAKYWISDESKRNHVGDIFTVFETENDTSIITGEYQFTADKLYDGDDESTTFYWKDCTGTSTHNRFSGEYTMYINLQDNTLWNQKEQISLTYLTDNPGNVTDITLKNPSNETTKKYVEPYIHINMDNGDEEAIYYSSYEIIGANGQDYTNRFLSLHASDLTYSGALKINGVNIPRNMSTEYPPSGSYTFKWNWTPSDSKSLTFSIKTINNLIKSIYRGSTPNRLFIEFTNGINTEYFFKKDPRTGLNVSEVNVVIYKQIDGVVDTSYDYFSLFKSIDESNTFTSEAISRIALKISENGILPPGTYSIAISNSSYSLDDSDNMFVLSGIMYLEQELCDNLPDISNVRLVDYKQAVTSPIKGAVSTNYYGTSNPYANTEMMTLMQEWTFMNELDYHIGDTYTNTITNEKYTFNLDKISGSYIWDIETSNPCLCVSFGNEPLLETSLKYIDNVRLYNDSSDVSSYINTNPMSWEYETSSVGGNTFISKLILGVNKNQNFYGASNVNLDLSWKDNCIYNNIGYGNLTLPVYMASFGSIKHVYALSEKDIDTNKLYQTLTIEFSQPMLTSMLNKAVVSLIYRQGNSGEIGEDYSSNFYSIMESNSETLLESETVNNVYLLLRDGKTIPSGIYDITINMGKFSSDISENDNDVILTGITDEIPWMTANIPTDISLELKKKSPFKLPVLRVTFTDSMPAYTSCRKEIPNSTKANCFKIKVVKQDTQKDYTSVFVNPDTSKSIGYNLNEEEPDLVESIDINMRKARCLPAGTYDVKFIFPSYALLGSLPTKKDGNNKEVVRSFTVSKTLITTVGKVKSFKATTKNQKLQIVVELNGDISTNSLIKNSQLGTALKIKSTKALLKKLSLNFEDGFEESFVSHINTKPVISGNKLTYSIKSNNKIDPGEYCAYYKYNGYEVMDRRSLLNFKGLIKNTAGGCQNDPVCYIIRETHDGKTRLKVYKTFNSANERISRMEKLNDRNEAQLAKCKKCRAKKFIGTKSIKASFDKFDFPRGTLGNAMGTGLKDFYKTISNKTAKCKKYNVKQIIAEDGDSIHFQCENYEKAKIDYDWEFLIATKPKNVSLSSGKGGKAVHIMYLNIDGIDLFRVYPTTKAGKTSKKCKAYSKKLGSYIKKYKKAVTKCNKCKKREIANKSKTSITWTTALFGIQVKNDSKFLKKFNAYFKKKVCKKASFKLSETNGGTQCKLSCSKYKKSKTMSYGLKHGTFIK